jgi:hypothetical protein
MSQELHEHQGLLRVAHAHALGDVVPQALVGGGGGLGHGGILAGIPCAGRLAGAGCDRWWHLQDRGPVDHPGQRMLPHEDQALVDEAKICDDLLSDTHPVGRFKARVFRSLGYTV